MSVISQYDPVTTEISIAIYTMDTLWYVYQTIDSLLTHMEFFTNTNFGLIKHDSKNCFHADLKL